MRWSDKVACALVLGSGVILFIGCLRNYRLLEYLERREWVAIFALGGFMSLVAFYKEFLFPKFVNKAGPSSRPTLFETLLSNSLPSISAVFSFGAGIALACCVIQLLDRLMFRHDGHWSIVVATSVACLLCLFGPAFYPVAERLTRRRESKDSGRGEETIVDSLIGESIDSGSEIAIQADAQSVRCADKQLSDAEVD